MGYYLMRARKEIQELLQEKILIIDNYDPDKKYFLIDEESIKKIENIFYKYGFSERKILKELEAIGLILDKEKGTIKKA